MRQPPRARAALAILLAVTVHAAPVAGDPSDPAAAREAARAHFARGLELADGGSLDEAAAEFRRAYDAAPHFGVLFNLGQTLWALGRPVEALQAFERYLSEGGREVPPDRRALVEERVRALDLQVARLTVTVTPAAGRLEIDGQPGDAHDPALGPTVVVLAPGSHVVRASAEGRQPVERRLNLTAGQALALELRLPVDEPPAPPAPLPPALSLVAAPPPPARARTAAYVLAGSALVLAATGVGLYAWNGGRYDDWSELDRALAADPNRPGWREQQADNNRLWESIGRVDWGARGLLAGAGVAAIAAVVAWRQRGPADGGQPLSLALAPGAVLLGARW